jgi:hypothetical protein
MSEMTKSSGVDGKMVVELALAWFVVAAPLLWGVAQTFNKALALFR